MVAQPIDFGMRRRLVMVSETKEKAPRIYQSANFLQVDMDVLELVHGDWKAACLLAKIIDMQQQSKDGWVYHSWPQWEKHHFSRAEVERCVDTLAPLGLEIVVRDHDGRLTRHYHVDVKKLKAAVAKLQKSYRATTEAQPDVSAIHPVEKLQGATKSHGAENLQGPCEKVTTDPVEKLQGLYERSDLVTISTETDQDTDANASGGTAHADAPAVMASRSKKKAEGAKDDALNAYRSRLLGVMRESYGSHLASEGKQVAAIKRMYEARAPVETVEACWRVTLIDPLWDTRSLDMATIEQRLPVFLKSPENYQRGMQRKREQQQAAEKRGNSNGQHHSVSPAQTTRPSRRRDPHEETARRTIASDDD